MNLKITITKAEYDRLQSNSKMLDKIYSIVAPYARGTKATTLECLLKMDAKLRDIKKATSTCGCCGSIEMATKIDKIINNIEETR